ncbi:FKBP-type peptidyl-prolyl cis-trans isomerase FklB [Maribacter vaceletii]|uniref:Peptidyl-prolyl cis-trans isomerase n=2 Tax=Maribacter vaceletii TaxID=1206816 RepID=A0A495EDM8_9FLAO|nr:FKBP-type peptidyl-prolyl cis-trans isomerase FklB [Maribacter vaceletii]
MSFLKGYSNHFLKQTIGFVSLFCKMYDISVFSFLILTIFASKYTIKMKNFILVAILLLVGGNSYAQKKKDLIAEVAKLKSEATEMKAQLHKIKKSKTVNLEDSLQKFSYAFGVEIGTNLKALGIDSLAYPIFAVALEDALNGNEKLSSQEARSEVQNTIQKIQEKKAKELSKAGDLFLAENAKRKGIVTTESGLQYEVIKEGNGAKPVATDKVKVHYEGKLIDEKVFDSSIERGEPVVFGVSQVIPGWTEALQLMPVGSKWKVFIPQDIAYGQRGAGGSIPPYSALIFDIELISIEK